MFIDKHLTNPFDTANQPDSLVRISFGVHASNDVQASLLNAVSNGQSMMESFVGDTLSTTGSKYFFLLQYLIVRFRLLQT